MIKNEILKVWKIEKGAAQMPGKITGNVPGKRKRSIFTKSLLLFWLKKKL
jgi:hypothetical protein